MCVTSIKMVNVSLNQANESATTAISNVAKSMNNSMNGLLKEIKAEHNKMRKNLNDLKARVNKLNSAAKSAISTAEQTGGKKKRKTKKSKKTKKTSKRKH